MINLSAVGKSIGVVAEVLKYISRANRSSESVVSLKNQWAYSVLSRLKVDVEIIGAPVENTPVVLVGNHLSYLDIPLLLRAAGNVSFVAKKEISSWPVFGIGAQKMDTVFVNRASGDSRKAARDSVGQALLSGKRVVIFPAGTTCVSESKPWKRGAFEIANHFNIPIQPFRLSYSPIDEVAFIGEDALPLHLYNLFCFEHAGKKIRAKIEFHEPILVSDPNINSQKWQSWSRGLLTV